MRKRFLIAFLRSILVAAVFLLFVNIDAVVAQLKLADWRYLTAALVVLVVEYEASSSGSGDPRRTVFAYSCPHRGRCYPFPPHPVFALFLQIRGIVVEAWHLAPLGTGFAKTPRDRNDMRR